MKYEEIESKFQIEEGFKNEFERVIQDRGVTGKISDQFDRYFDTKGAEYFIRGIFLRIRGTRFQMKFNLEDVLSGSSSGHVRCTEVDLPLILDEEGCQLLRDVLRDLSIDCPVKLDSPFDFLDYNRLFESVVIQKRRVEFELDNIIISLDEVQGLGSFLEIEYRGDGPALSEVERDLIALVKDGPATPIDTGYNALFWRNRDRGIYLQSPYVMESDRDI